MKCMDIRDQANLSGEEIGQLNFIRASKAYVFRKFYRAGLRSHIFEMLKAEDVSHETCGIMKEGIRVFPRAVPVKMFRIFRNRFQSKEEIFHEIRRYKLLLAHLGPRFIAQSQEFIADYQGTGPSRIILCGLQEYVAGEILDPWRLNGPDSVKASLATMTGHNHGEKALAAALENIEIFVTRIRKMISQTGYIPDLAGVGNLILTPKGGIRLVDINNIVKVNQDPAILLDDKGYPACDVSVQVLFILENQLLGKDADPNDPLAQIFLDAGRREAVKAIEREFYKKLALGT